ncbi:MAG: PAS domain-containing protein [Pseudomonadota bacterium]
MPDVLSEPTRTGAAHSPQIDRALQYWQELRRTRAVPARAEIDPIALRPYLGHSGVVERSSEGHVTLRVAGQRVRDIVQVDPRGLALSDMFDPADRGRLHHLLSQMFDTPALLTMTLDADDAESGLTRLALMPLRDTSGIISRALMVLTPGDGPQAGLFRIGAAHVTPTRGAAPGVRGAERPYLRVIEGGRA